MYMEPSNFADQFSHIALAKMNIKHPIFSANFARITSYERIKMKMVYWLNGIYSFKKNLWTFM